MFAQQLKDKAHLPTAVSLEENVRFGREGTDFTRQKFGCIKTNSHYNPNAWIETKDGLFDSYLRKYHAAPNTTFEQKQRLKKKVKK